MKTRTQNRSHPSALPNSRVVAQLIILMVSLSFITGCGGAGPRKKNQEFFTSGSREADQRASQHMAKAEQLSGSGEGSGEKGVKKSNAGGTGDKAVQNPDKLSLFERLGGLKGLQAIVDDMTPRVIQDPRVDWERKSIKHGGLSLKKQPAAMWQPAPENVERLKQHFVQFLALATGGPAQYEGRDMRGVHQNMRITNPEFDAVVGDLKASLDKLQVPNTEQKELLAIIESTRPQVVTQR